MMEIIKEAADEILGVCRFLAQKSKGACSSEADEYAEAAKSLSEAAGNLYTLILFAPVSKEPESEGGG